MIYSDEILHILFFVHFVSWLFIQLSSVEIVANRTRRNVATIFAIKIFRWHILLTPTHSHRPLGLGCSAVTRRALSHFDRRQIFQYMLNGNKINSAIQLSTVWINGVHSVGNRRTRHGDAFGILCEVMGTRQSTENAILSHRFVRIILIQFITGRLMCAFYSWKRQTNLFRTLRSFIHFRMSILDRCWKNTHRKSNRIHWKINRLARQCARQMLMQNANLRWVALFLYEPAYWHGNATPKTMTQWVLKWLQLRPTMCHIISTKSFGLLKLYLFRDYRQRNR